MADDLSSQSFIAILRCFMARKGKFSKFYSEIGTNFVGAQKELVSMIKRAGVSSDISRFQPVSAPHFGSI